MVLIMYAHIALYYRYLVYMLIKQELYKTVFESANPQRVAAEIRAYRYDELMQRNFPEDYADV
jgi:hypothetical protein